jgi:NAD(P)H-hydrate repair Nnr-like enzyme with NAD(P)H-hydrate dehydratase domain
MTTIRSAYKRPAVFRLPDLKKRRAPVVAPNMNELSRLASDRRVLEATPKLKAVEEFLRESKARVP